MLELPSVVIIKEDGQTDGCTPYIAEFLVNSAYLAVTKH